jgi:uncharacterized protein
MSVLRRVVLDTSTLVSAALRVGSLPHQVLLKALGTCEVCVSSSTLDELEQVFKRGKFDRYLDAETRLAFMALVRQYAHLFAVPDADELIVQPVCRDPKDNKFLALALVCEADAIVSSDHDLPVLNPWRSMPVLKPAEFVDLSPDGARLGEKTR